MENTKKPRKKSSKPVDNTLENFEESLKRLQEIVETLEEGKSSLEESMKLYQEGVKLSKLCQNQLDKAKHDIALLNEDGSTSPAPQLHKNIDDDFF